MMSDPKLEDICRQPRGIIDYTHTCSDFHLIRVALIYLSKQLESSKDEYELRVSRSCLEIENIMNKKLKKEGK